jgi:hypothetical protein
LFQALNWFVAFTIILTGSGSVAEKDKVQIVATQSAKSVGLIFMGIGKDDINTLLLRAFTFYSFIITTRFSPLHAALLVCSGFLGSIPICWQYAQRLPGLSCLRQGIKLLRPLLILAAVTVTYAALDVGSIEMRRVPYCQ